MPPVRVPQPVAATGVVLAGGAGRRMGGDKALTPVLGRPLIVWPLDALRRVCRPVTVVARSSTALPPELIPTPEVWPEDDDAARHPLSGIVHALRRAGDRAVLVCAADMPLLDAATLRVLLTAASLSPDAPVVVPEADGRLQVLCALYRPPALVGLEGFAPDARTADLVRGLGPAVVPFADGTPFFNVNAHADVPTAERLLLRRGWRPA